MKRAPKHTPKNKGSYITVTDQFCGAGGSSQGVRNFSQRIGGGVELLLGLNHWQLAIDTHSTNFPDAMHDCTDIQAADPRRYPSTNILITSPECTNHSLAKGQKQVKAQLDLWKSGQLDPVAERSRATMWDVPRFAEYHNYDVIIVENVVDARKWVMWDSWLMAMHSLGYMHKCCYFNSMHFHPTPQSRDRMYVVFWKKGNKAPNLEYMPRAYCPQCEHDVEAIQVWKKHKFGKYKTQYTYKCPVHQNDVTPYYFAAFNAIDWSDRGTRIGDRDRDLSPKTKVRIQWGLDKYWHEPFQVVNYSPGYAKPVTDPTGTITTTDHHGFAFPFTINDQHSTGVECRVGSVGDKLSTVTGTPHFKLIMPFVIKGEHTHGTPSGKVKQASSAFQTQTTRQTMSLIMPQLVTLKNNGKSHPTNQVPFQTVEASGNKHYLLMPVMVDNKGKSKASRSVDPLTTVTTKPHHGIVTHEAMNSFLQCYYGGSNVASHITEATRTVSTKDRMYLINSVQPRLEDCYYRMIKPPEVKAAMAFDSDYIILGSGKDQVKQCGNAVTPPVMEWLIERAVESLS